MSAKAAGRGDTPHSERRGVSDARAEQLGSFPPRRAIPTHVKVGDRCVVASEHLLDLGQAPEKTAQRIFQNPRRVGGLSHPQDREGSLDQAVRGGELQCVLVGQSFEAPRS